MKTKFSLIASTRDPTAQQLAWLRTQESRVAELIVVANPGRCGLGEAYNEGLEQARSEFCCFLHDDVEVRTPGWLDRLAQVVECDGFDLVGIAGATMLPRNGAWWNCNAGAGRGSVHHRLADGKIEYHRFGGPSQPERNVSPVVSLDGVLLFGRREHFLEQPFDENFFDGFHFYDSDLSLRWLLWDFRRLAVVHDLDVVHRLNVSLDEWKPYLNRFHYRHGGHLPCRLEHVLTWEQNLRALKSADSKTAALLTSFRRPGQCLSYESGNDGAVIAKREGGDFTFTDRQNGSATANESEALILLGAGTGQRLGELLQSCKAPVLVIEPEAHLICWLLCRYDWSGHIESGRLRWHIPTLDRPELAEIALRECQIALAQIQRDSTGADNRLQTGSATLNKRFFDALAASLQTPAKIAQRIGGWPNNDRATPYDVTVVSPNCSIFDDLAGCFERLGLRVHHLRVTDRPTSWSTTRWLGALRAILQKPSPVTILRNRVMLETADPRSKLDLGRFVRGRVVSWWWDVPNVASVIDFEDAAARRPSYTFAREILSLLPEGSQWLPPGARSNFVAFDAERAEPDQPLTFVGQSRFDLLQQNLNVLANALVYFRGRIGQTLADEVGRSRGMRELYQRLSKMADDLRSAISACRRVVTAGAYYLEYLLDMALTASFRLAAVESVSRLPLRVFGDDGWIRSGAVSRDAFAGLVAPNRLPEIYSRSRLNLNVTFAQVASTVNPKVLDACACGGAVLTDPRPELADLFPDPTNRPTVFDSLDSLPDVASDLLRADLAEHRLALRTHVHSHHTLLHRARTLVEQLDLRPG